MELIIKSPCLFKCLALDITDDEITGLINAIEGDLPEEVKTYMRQKFPLAFAGSASLRMLLFIKFARGLVVRTQTGGSILTPTGIIYRKGIAPRIKKSIRKSIARKSIKLVGRGGLKIFGKLGGKFLAKLTPLGWIYTGIESCRCVKACKDNYYSDFETKSAVVTGTADFNGKRFYD